MILSNFENSGNKYKKEDKSNVRNLLRKCDTDLS